MKTGKVHGKTAARHTSEEFVDFLGQVVEQCRPQQEIHIIVDNLSAHKTRKEVTFHADALVVAEPGGDLVCTH